MTNLECGVSEMHSIRSWIMHRINSKLLKGWVHIITPPLRRPQTKYLLWFIAAGTNCSHFRVWLVLWTSIWTKSIWKWRNSRVSFKMESTCVSSWDYWKGTLSHSRNFTLHQRILNRKYSTLPLLLSSWRMQESTNPKHDLKVSNTNVASQFLLLVHFLTTVQIIFNSLFLNP